MLMISGECMKKYVVVKQKHLYTQERNLMFEGYAEVVKNDSYIALSYVESDQKTNVNLVAEQGMLKIKREGEMNTDLNFCSAKKTRGCIMSEFGNIELSLFTHKYIKKENIIAIEYDILHEGMIVDGYRIIWMIKEDVHE